MECYYESGYKTKSRVQATKKRWHNAGGKAFSNEEHWNGIANRLYYAAFYAVVAWMQQNNINTKTHSETRIKFNELLITKVLPERYADIYFNLFSNRQDGDYEDFMIFTEKETEPFIQETENLINEIKKLIIQ